MAGARGPADGTGTGRDGLPCAGWCAGVAGRHPVDVMVMSPCVGWARCSPTDRAAVRPRPGGRAHTTSESCGGCAPRAARRDAVQAIHIRVAGGPRPLVSPRTWCAARTCSAVQCTDSWLGGVVVEEELCGMR